MNEEFKIGDTVKFTLFKKEYTGTVVEVKENTCLVQFATNIESMTYQLSKSKLTKLP